MSSQKVVESSNTEARTSRSSHTYNTDAFSTLGTGEGRTFQTRTNSSSMSAALTGSSSWYTERTITGHLARHSSAVMRRRRADISPSTVDTAELETITLRIHSPEASVSSLSYNNHPTIEDTGQARSSTNTDRSISSSRTDSASVSDLSDSDRESPLRTLRDLSSSRKVTQIFTTSSNELSSSSDLSDSYMLTPRQNGHLDLSPGHPSFTEDITEVSVTHSQAPSEIRAAEDSGQLWSSTNTDRSLSSSHTDSVSVPDLSDRAGERTLRTLRDISSSHNVTQIFTTSSKETPSSSGYPSYVWTPQQNGQTDLSPGHPPFTEDITEAAVTHSQASSDTRAVEDSRLMRSSSNTERMLSSSHMDSASVSDLADRDEEKTLQTLRDISSFHNATQMSIMANTKIPSSTDFADSSYVWTSEQKRRMNLSPGNTDLTQSAVTYSQAPSEMTAAEDSGQLWSSTNTESISSSHTDSVSVPDLSGRAGERTLRTLRDTSSSHNITQIFTTSSNEIPSSSGLTAPSYVWTPQLNGQTNLSPDDHDFTEEVVTLSQAASESTAVEDIGQPRTSSNTDRSISSSHMDSASIPVLSDRGQTRKMDLSSRNPEFTEAAVTLSEARSETIAVEDSSQMRSSSNTERMLSTSHTNSVSHSGLFDRDEERTLQTLRDVSSSHKATQMSTTANSEIPRSTDFSNSSHVWTAVQNRQMNLSSGNTDFTESAVTYPQAPSEITAEEDSGQMRSSSNTERMLSSSHMDSASVSGLSDRDEERTLQTLRDTSSSHKATQMSSTANSKPPSSTNFADSTYVWTAVQTKQMNLAPEDSDSTETAIIHSQSPSEITDVKSSQHTFSNINIEKRTTQTEGTFSTVTLVRGGGGTLASLTNMSKSTDATELPTSDLENTSSSVLTSSTTSQGGKESSSSTEMDFTESLKEPLLTYSSKASIYSFSTIDFLSTGSSLQTVKGSVEERRLSSASTDGVYLSTTFTHGGERTSRSLPDNNTSSDAVASSTYNTETFKSSDPTLTLTSVTETEKHNDSLSELLFTMPSTEHTHEHSSVVPMYSSSPKDSSTIGGDHSISSSRVSNSYTENTVSSAPFRKGEEQTVQAMINTTFAEATESTSLYMEKYNSSELNLSSPEVYSRTTDLGISGPSTETFQSLSSLRIPTYSSFQSESSDTGMDYQPMSSTDTGKRISDSHTDSTYISTTFTRGGERTLLSISNNSTSADSSESFTSYAEISSPSESVQSSFSVTQSKGSNMSSSTMDFSAPSTEPLAVHSPKTPGYSSTVREPHTTQFYSESPSTSPSTLSFSSSPPTSPTQDALPTTQPPTSFSSSESPLPSSSSAFPLSSHLTSLITFSPKLSSTALPTLLPLPSLLPSLSSTPSSSQSSEILETSASIAASEETTGIDSSTTGSPHSKYNQTGRYPLKDSTAPRSTGPSPLLSETTEQLTNHSSPVTISLEETKDSEGQNISFPGTSAEKNVPVLHMSPTSLPKTTTISETAKARTSTLPSTTTQKDLVEVTTGKNLPKITHTTLGLSTLASSTDFSGTTKPHKVQPPSPTKISHTTGMPTKGIEKTSATTVKVTEHVITSTHPPKTFSSSKATAGPFSASPGPTKPTTVVRLQSPKAFPSSHGKASVCTADSCLKNGKCITDGLTGKFQCQCSAGWQGEDCSMDVDECLSNPCPALATCTNTQGSFQCMCSLGYRMEKGKCNLVRTFVGQFPLTFNTTGRYSELHQVEEDIINMLNESLTTLPGYYSSTVKASRQSGTIQVSVLSTFSLISNVTLYEIVSTLRSHIRACKAPTETCQFISNLTLLYRVGGLCKHKDPECDKETSVCMDLDGIAVCQCKPGYFKYNKLDHSCRACEDGYRLENDTCVSCPFGLGGFNCGNPYQLITIVIAAAGGGLLLIMGIALIVTCCQKNKNDISKLIFKSGDFQMSPYAEYPKNPRGQDWGRETIEMQENGSTKNLLQMTDVYYMPTNLRNPEVERNGLYPPYTGLPGSRHSCIYPGQYNPSFISDDSRRRDYF
ncbi:protein HEG homolog 1 isoform X2 [Elgaria multicarinata webbii]|uniref:protein HEG homolog 1 isoform X2 n=1 Tax=Elgaria multicarinata webbii TaxID=159646 RepID=UPI002FCCCD69